MKEYKIFLNDLTKLLDGEYAPHFRKIPEKYQKGFKSWTKDVMQQDWGYGTLTGGKKVSEEVSLENWNRGWQIYNREAAGTEPCAGISRQPLNVVTSGAGWYLSPIACYQTSDRLNMVRGNNKL